MKKEQLKSYDIPADLLQAIADNLNGQPAGQVRHLLNTIEFLVNKQQEEFDAKVTDEPNKNQK
jgi:hypothetical protein